MKKAIFTIILLTSLLLVSGAKDEAGPSENVLPKTQATLKGDGSLSFPLQRMTLEPFYLIQEKAAKAWVERIIVTIELNQDKKITAEFDHPHLRSLLFNILISEPEKSALPDKMQAALNQALGKAAVTSVHLRRSFLLL